MKGRIRAFSGVVLFGFALFPNCLLCEDVTIKEIRIRGNSYTKDETILHLLPFSQGDRFDEDKVSKILKKTHQRLLESGYFDSIKVFILPSKERQRVILIEVKEGNLWRLGAGLIYLKLGQENLWGKGRSITTKLGVNLQEVEYLDPNLMNRSFILKGRVRHFAPDVFSQYIVETGNEEEPSFKMEGTTVEFTFGHRSKQGLRLGLCGAVEHLGFDLRDLAGYEEDTLGVEKQRLLFNLVSFVELDTRNKKRSPTSGYRLSATWGLSKDLWEPKLSFSRIRLDWRCYMTPWEGHTFSTRLQTGLATNTTSYFYLFNIGKFNIRDEVYKIDGLRAPGYRHYIGSKMLLLSLEYKRRIVSFHLFSVVELSLEGCLFFDVGRTWDNGEDVTFQDLDTAWGIGGRIRVTSSVSLEVRLEWGFGVRGSGFYWKAF